MKAWPCRCSYIWKYFLMWQVLRWKCRWSWSRCSGWFQWTDFDVCILLSLISVIGIRDQKEHEKPEEPQYCDLQLCREPAAQSLQHVSRPSQPDHLLEGRAAGHLWWWISEVSKCFGIRFIFFLYLMNKSIFVININIFNIITSVLLLLNNFCYFLNKAKIQ